MSLRARLLFVSVALVAAGLLVANVATYRTLASSLLRRVDEQLVEAARTASFALREGPDPAGPSGPFPGPGDVRVPPGTYAELRSADGAVLDQTFFGFGQGATYATPDIPDDPLGEDGTARTFSVGASEGRGRFRVLAVPTRTGGVLVVAVPLAETAATLRRLLAVELVVSVIVLVLVGVLAAWLVRVGLKPLEGIGATAESIAAGDLTRRVEPDDDRTEVGRLGRSLNGMLARIQAAFEEREASEARLRRFVADASHELRTPLTSIRGYAELFRRGAKDRPEDLGAAMARIEDEAARMGILVDDLLLLARLDQGRPLEREPLDLAVVVDAAAQAAGAVEPDRPIDVATPPDAWIVGDAARLRQALDNLFENVRRHTPAGTPVHVVLEAADEDVTLTVRDDGPGMDAETRARAFERFFRGDPSRSRETGGTGLGLSIVAAIVDAHGGSVAAPEDPDGARIEIHLPRARTDEERASLRPPLGPGHDRRSPMDEEMKEAAEELAADAVGDAVVAEALHEDAVEKAAEAGMLYEAADELAAEAVVEEAAAEELMGDAVAEAEVAVALDEAADEDGDDGA